PTRPETGYGYIRMGETIPGATEGDTVGHDVAAFVEKPDQTTAEGFLADGGYLWNSGMLVARASTVLAELSAAGQHRATPESGRSAEIAEVACAVAALAATEWTGDDARAWFAALPSVPFDKAVLEVSEAVAVVPADLAWSDVGSLAALESIAEPDEHGNVHSGNVLDIDSHDSIVYSADRLVATIGLQDLMVVDTADATLVAPKNRAQDVRLVVNALKANGARETVENRSSLRPWGKWTMLVKGSGFQVKTIEVLPGRRLSLQSHKHRSEHWVVVEGRGRITRGTEVFDVRPNESAYIPRGFTHRLENPGVEVLRIVEIAVGDYLGEDDITRYEDDWER
ncbi:MAG: sugar phosphate nucleotidyltransferase, partial [Coriobacteriia bacterium]|nr:sugar phosphate nucleotidyltransferase [Coriobacteriia bacterium]